MDPRDAFSSQWPARPAFSHKRPRPGAVPNLQYISPYAPLQQPVPQVVDPRQLHFSSVQYAGSYQDYPPTQAPFEASVLPQPHIPFESFAEFHQPPVPLTSSEYHIPLNRPFVTSGPVVHEGFIPAPGHEDDDDLEGLFPYGYRNPLLQDQSEDDDSEDERALQAEEERILRDIEEKNDDIEFDSDFSMADLDELDDDPDELLLDDEIDDEEEEQARRRPSGGRGTKGSRGVRAGRGSRLRGRGRGGHGGSTRGRKGKERPPGRPKGKHGPRPVADPGPQFKEFQRIANEAYLRKDYPTAIEYANKAIQNNPEIFAAHSLLSEIFSDMGNKQKSLEALIVGAPTKRDKELWFYIIDHVKQIDPDEYPLFTNANKTAVILDCLNAILRIDGEDYEARTQKLEIVSQLGQVSKCVRLCRKMLTMKPYEDGVLKIMARVGTSSAKQTRFHLQKIITSFDTSIAYFLKHDKSPSKSNLDWSLLNIYLDLLDRSGDYVRGLSRLKSLSRWIQNRKEETYWDEQDDDREFDIEDEPRRTTVPQFSRVSSKAKYGKALPLEIRVKMGLFRLRQKPPHFEEAMHHFEMLEPEDDGPDPVVRDYPDLYRDVADALHVSGLSDEALRFYEPLYDLAFKHMSLRDFIGMYSSYKAIGHEEKARELLPIFRKWNPDKLEDLAILAKFFEDNDMEDDAMKRGEAVYKHGGGYLLRKIEFQGYLRIQGYLADQRKRARGKHGVRKARVNKYRKALRVATGDGDESQEEGHGEAPSLGPITERPKSGLFRTRKLLPALRPKTFLPDDTVEIDVPMDAIDQSLFARKLKDLVNDFPEDFKEARAQHREIVSSFQRLEELSETAEEGNEEAILEWIMIARELIEEFSTFDLFYYDRRREFIGYFRRVGSGGFWKDSALMVLAVRANDYEDGYITEPDLKEKPERVPVDFYGIHFEKWFDIFARYAIFCARRGEEDRCFNTIEVVGQSNIFYRSQRYTQQLQICRLACALALDDSLQGASAIRWLLRTYPFSSDLFRLYGGANRYCSIPSGFATSPGLKVLLRYIKTMDYALLKSDQREWYNFRGSDHIDWMSKSVSSDILKYVKDHDPALFALYAHVLMCGGSYMAALNYYFRAFAITPQDPVLNLCIGVAYIQHAMKRLSENRQFQIQQGLSFIYRYYEIRTKDNVDVHCSEAEFNMGRIWHSLGLLSQAIPFYERCVQVGERVRDKAKQNEDNNGSSAVDNFASEAAFAIQMIYALSGNFEGAGKVTERALVIE